MIETRHLTNESTQRPPIDGDPRRLTIEAANPDDAINKFLRQNDSELVSLTKPLRGRESIATVKKNDSMFLVRVYAA